MSKCGGAQLYSQHSKVKAGWLGVKLSLSYIVSLRPAWTTPPKRQGSLESLFSQ